MRLDQRMKFSIRVLPAGCSSVQYSGWNWVPMIRVSSFTMICTGVISVRART